LHSQVLRSILTKRTLLLLLAAALLCARGAAARQEPCRLERSVAPDYGGVMLGMRVEELALMFPGSEDLQKGPPAGDASKPFVASLGGLELSIRREHFGDVAELLLTFIGGTLQRIDVRYRQPVAWHAVTQFSEQASKRLAVPSDAWGPPANDAQKQSRVLDCRGFSVVVRMDRGGPSTLSIVDTSSAKEESGAAPAASPPATPPRKRPKRPKKPRPAAGQIGKEG
jgi:hypothetical protein